MASIVEPLGSMAAAWRAFAGTMNCPGSGKIAAGASIVKRFFGGIATLTRVSAAAGNHVFVMPAPAASSLRSQSGAISLTLGK
jgi:hypothetical protein